MTIKEGTGNLLLADAEALVNTVNTVGVMGKGIALQFKKAYPANFKAYESAVRQGELQLGRVFVYRTGKLEENPKYIINFPTKKHWRSKSKLSDIAEGLKDLVREVEQLSIKSIAVPPLGCGLGGLNWKDVRPLIVDAFSGLNDVMTIVYPPAGTPFAAEMPSDTLKPALTRVSAAILGVLQGYVGQVGRGATAIEIQKLAYLLERVGEPLDLRFTKGHYGPYSVRLDHVLNGLESHFISGFGDRSQRVAEAEPIVIALGAEDEIDRAAKSFDAATNIELVLSLVDGFNSAYGTELLASVDWSVTQETGGSSDIKAVIDVLQQWNRRKSRLFTESHVASALQRLQSYQLLTG